MKARKKRILNTIVLMILALFGTGIAVNNTEHGKINEKTGEMTIHFLDVGQGLAILVQSDGQSLLYDGGDRSSSDFVVSYLKKQQIEKIDYLISSHYDEDHVSGLVGCLNTFEVSNVIGADYVHESGLYESFMDGVRSQGLEVQHPDVGECFPFGTGEFTILSPDEIKENDSNGNSVAIKLTNGNNAFLFMGDAEYKSEAEIIASGIDIECDVLSVGHHGSASSTSWDFLKETVPEYAVISCGAGNQYGHPDADTMEKLHDMEIEIYRSDKQGMILCTSAGEKLIWSEEPCNDYSPGDADDPGTQPGRNERTDEDNRSVIGLMGKRVWVTASGEKYHSVPDCGKMNPDTAEQMSLAMAKILGYSPCQKCN